MKSKLFPVFVFASIVITLFSACLKTNSTPAPTGPMTFVTAFNAAHKAPLAELYFDNNKETQAMVPGNYFTRYSQTAAGTFTVSFKKAGTDSVIATLGNATYDSANFYSFLLYDDYSTHTSKLYRVHDVFNGLNTTSAFIRFFNLASDSLPVDVYLGTSLFNTNRTNADNVLQTGYNNFTPVSAGSYIMFAKVPGSDSVIAKQEGVNIEKGYAYTFYLHGLKGGTLSNALQITGVVASN